ncbi:hypothetical protein N7462_005371 [Penicillium macrosclerotiorum]|uniref:uncharacterized protein n=1 Tax=Penicillium macrosclerotiorum TaxID=303699 RepID=UPI002547F9E5|nr:uncharacterized protein N7462_005371 [Penicillium macrosclerotiorum]KAJ5682206.1 hypothetical protein N7462_005371 [Penicillium macrosclerotiorum]
MSNGRLDEVGTKLAQMTEHAERIELLVSKIDLFKNATKGLWKPGPPVAIGMVSGKSGLHVVFTRPVELRTKYFELNHAPYLQAGATYLCRSWPFLNEKKADVDRELPLGRTWNKLHADSARTRAPRNQGNSGSLHHREHHPLSTARQTQEDLERY